MTDINLPQWLDSIIYDKYEAIYEPRPQEVAYNPDQPYEFVRLYLGTYFPRSFAEAHGIMLKLFQNITYREHIFQREEINIFDFCCGTGGEIVGMITILQQLHSNLKRINIDAVDANSESILFLYHLIEEIDSADVLKVELHINPMCLFIETDQDLNDLVRMLNRKYHYVLSFKAINEFIQKGTYSDENVYGKIADYFLPLLSSDGSLILSDITTKFSNRNLFYPQMLNRGINELVRSYIKPHSCIPVMYKSVMPIACFYHEEICEGCYMQDIFTISHSRKSKDVTKVAYRIICYADFANKIMTDINPNNCRYVNPFVDKHAPYC